MNNHLKSNISFASRHIGISNHEKEEMLQTIGTSSLETLIEETIPASIRLKKPLNIPDALSEYDYLKELKKVVFKNKVFKNYIGLGYYDCIVPGVIQRNIFENPGWYTQYTPYQAEIAQGRLEALLNFQTMICDLTKMEIANASLLDEATAAAEAMVMLHSIKNKNQQQPSNKFFVSETCFPQTIDVLKTKSTPLGIKLEIGDHRKIIFNDSFFGAIVQFPAQDGNVFDYSEFITQAHQANIYVAVAADLMSLTLLTPPGEMGADVVIGNSQRFGIPMGYGGPHAAYFATRNEFVRQMPGRIIGVSVDNQNNKAYRMTLQTREQHIKREKATSNICTAQALLAIMSGMYAVYHGPKNLRAIASGISALCKGIEGELKKMGYHQENEFYFDTLKISISDNEFVRRIKEVAEKEKVNFRYFDEKTIGISISETTSVEDAHIILGIFESAKGGNDNSKPTISIEQTNISFPENLLRKSEFLTHPVFNTHHTETEMLRYIKRLENKDLSLTHSMISLGSCTMKLNATSEMIPLSWAHVGNIHPFTPSEQVKGYAKVIEELESYLCKITGFAACSLQPNSGAQGEYAGLMVIRAYHHDRNERQRNVVLIPQSAHGTNPASAVMAGMQVVVVHNESGGAIDVNDLKAKAEQYKDSLAALMVTYPSTYGFFDENILDVCKIIHEHGGLVYMDGANMNAQVGLTSPARIGADVCHLNLHKTFAIPHGGGGPGMGPICVTKHLAPYLPGHIFMKQDGNKQHSAVSAAPWGSASILLISYGYIKMLGADGCTDATRYAILNANYIKTILEKHFPILYVGKNNRVAHELILDCRDFKKYGIEVEDIAKRLVDYGFHAPTVSFPVPGTLMIEPTESESKDELDRFCEAMIAIRKEIQEVADGASDHHDNVLKNAPHTLQNITSDNWSHTYTRSKAAYPLPYLHHHKFWASVGRINNTIGDRNLMCVCPPIEAYSEETV